MGKKRYYIYLILSILLLVVFLLDLMFGSVSFSLKELLTSQTGREILYEFRIPKAIVALLCGISLSVCGLQMQTLFRNPLADPYILGISSGAGLGVAIYLMGLSLFGSNVNNPIFQSLGTAGAALIGAVAVTILILYVSQKIKGNLSLLIFGVMIGFISGALVNLLQYTSNAHSLKAYVLWTMGSFAGLDKLQICILLILILIGLIISIANIKDLNSILLGEEHAVSIGLNTKRIRNKILISTTLLAGAVTAFCGPIGFLGIAVPHIARFIFKDANHKVLLPASALIGAILTLCADAISQLPGTGSVVPINTMAALFGIPIIIAIIFKKK